MTRLPMNQNLSQSAIMHSVLLAADSNETAVIMLSAAEEGVKSKLYLMSSILNSLQMEDALLQ